MFSVHLRLISLPQYNYFTVIAYNRSFINTYLFTIFQCNDVILNYFEHKIVYCVQFKFTKRKQEKYS